MHVIIRPRGGDFLYSEEECEIMFRDIEMARKIGVDGVVMGCLTANGEVDVEKMQKLMVAAGDMSVTSTGHLICAGSLIKLWKR